MKDKIIFWLDADLLHFVLAKSLQDTYECDLFAIIDITNRPKKFFQKQQFVKFLKVWYYHDHINKNHSPDLIYLSSFEKKYNINLWQLALNERIFYQFNNFHKFTTNEILSILEQECKLFESILEEVRPDFFITQVTALHHQHLFYEICKAKGIKILMLCLTNIGYKCIISQESSKLDSPVNLTDITYTDRNFEDLQNYLKSFNFSKQVKNYQNRRANSKIELLKAAIDFLFTSNKNTKTHYSYYGRTKLRVLVNIITSALKKRYRQSFINNHLETEIDYNESFVYFPLPMEQERATLIGAPFYTNSIELIRNIVKSLPVNYKLYVKEHPAQLSRDWRRISDYKEIMNIPNVRLIHPSVSIEKLYKDCSLVIAVGAAPGFEAALYEKPSIIFTDTDYSILPSVFRVKEIEELPKVIRLSLQKKVNPLDLDKYLTFLDKNYIDFDLFGFQIKEFVHFYFGGHSQDVEIPLSKMKSFLEENKSIIDKLSLEHIKKIKQYKKYEYEKHSNSFTTETK